MSRHELNQWLRLNHEVSTFVDNAVDVQYVHYLFVPQTCRSDDERWGHGIHGPMFAAFIFGRLVFVRHWRLPLRRRSQGVSHTVQQIV